MDMRSVRKVSDLILFFQKPGDLNEVRLHEVTLNLYTHAWTFSCLSIPSVAGKQRLSEVVFSALVGFSLYITSMHYRINQSPKGTTGMSSVAYVMLPGATDRSCGQQAIGPFVTIMLQHIPRTFSRKPDSCGLPDSLLSWCGSLRLLTVPCPLKIWREH